MVKVFFLIMVIFCCNNCIKTIHTSGYLFETEKVEALQEVKTKQEIEELLGSPTSVSNFGQETWYYINSKKEALAFLPEKIIEQTIIAISFNGSQVDIIAKYNEENANNSDMVSEYTLIRGNDSSKAQQIIGNFGRFNSNKPPEQEKPRSGF